MSATPDPRLALMTTAIHMTRHPRHSHYCRCDELARAALSAIHPTPPATDAQEATEA